MRTAIYIDGFNFYYGAVKDTGYKCLYPKQPCETILQPQHTIISVVYCSGKWSRLHDNKIQGDIRVNRKRRQLLTLLAAVPALQIATPALSQNQSIWTVQQTYEALSEDQIRLLDIRSQEEWHETGVARGAWPVSMHDRRFPKRLGIVLELAENRPIALICATGGRSASVVRALRLAGYNSFIDVSEGMLGSRFGPGWIKAGLPIISVDKALDALPDALV